MTDTRAAVVERFGRNWSIVLSEVPKPSCAADEVLIRVHAATVNRTDTGELLHPLLNRIITRAVVQRRILGMDFAGEVEAVGESVTRFQPGDRVFGMCPLRRNGAQSDHVLVSEAGAVAIMSAGLPFVEAAVCEGAYYASGSIAEFGLGPGHRILIYGASGAIGSAAVQLAKIAGAAVTAVVATPHLTMAASLGADRVLDYQEAEYRALGPEFDFLLDAVGKMERRQWQPLLKPGGRFATTDMGPRGQSMRLMMWSRITGSRQVAIPLPAKDSAPKFVHWLGERIAAGEYRAIVDKTYPLTAISDAYRHVLGGHKAGIVAIDVSPV